MVSSKLLEYISSGQSIKFYQSPEWRRKRAEIIRRDHNECQRCRQQGKFSKGQCVHHIKHLKDYPLLALTNNNLITLCNDCHNAVHPEKNKNPQKKGFVNEERW